MLFTNINLNITEIKRLDYRDDSDYYQAILKCKGLHFPKNTKNVKKNNILQNIKL